MAKLSVVNREEKRKKLVKKHLARRNALKKIIRDVNSTYDEREDAQRALNSLPRNSSPVRVQNRCRLTGPPSRVLQKIRPRAQQVA